jgi:hypothetical protein
MAEKLAQASVEHELITVPEGGHGLNEVQDAKMAEIYDTVGKFLRSRMG